MEAADPRHEAKEEIFDGVASVAKALGSGRRGEVVDVLAQGERSVESLSIEISQSVANTSHHLQVLARAGLVRRRREGTHIYYQLSSERVADLWAALRDVASVHVSGFHDLVDAYLGDRESLEPVTRSELAGRLEDEDLVLLDVRPASEYAAGHIPSARSVPIEDIHELLQTLPDDAYIVAYCRGPHCVYALDAVRVLTAKGRMARRMEGGLPEWRRDGLPVTSEEVGCASASTARRLPRGCRARPIRSPR